MITLAMPHIVVEKVIGGFVVQWTAKNPDIKSPKLIITKTQVCIDKESLLCAIDMASEEISSN